MRARARTSTAIRFDPTVYEALCAAADERDMSVNWVVNRLCAEGLERLNPASMRLTVPLDGPT